MGQSKRENQVVDKRRPNVGKCILRPKSNVCTNGGQDGRHNGAQWYQIFLDRDFYSRDHVLGPVLLTCEHYYGLCGRGYECFISRRGLAFGLILLQFHGRDTKIDLFQSIYVYHIRGMVNFKLLSSNVKFKTKFK